MTPDELTAIEQRAHAADVVVRALCHGAKWHMSIPVQPDDSDVIISATLNDGEALCREVRRLTAELAAAKADTARLDWLQSRGASPSPSEDDGVEYWHYGVSSDCAASLREIIDTLRVARAAGEDV